VAEIVKTQRGEFRGASSGDSGTLVPVGGVQAPAPRGAEHERVWLAGEPVAAEMLFEYLCDQTRQRYGAAPGGCRGFGPVAAHLGGGFGHLQLVVRDVELVLHAGRRLRRSADRVPDPNLRRPTRSLGPRQIAGPCASSTCRPRILCDRAGAI